MLKKILFLGGGLGLTGFLLFGTAAFHHVEHGVSWMRGKVKDSVPIEYELERARDLIEKTDPQMRQCKRVIATKQVEIKYLRDEITQLDSRLTRDKSNLRRKAELLSDTRKVAFRVNRGQVSRSAYERDAAALLKRVKTADQVLGSKAQRLQALENSLYAAKVRLEKIKVQREALTAQVAQIEAKMQEAEAKQAMALDLDVDDSALHQAQSVLSDLNKRLDVELEIIEMEKPLLDDFAVEEEMGDEGLSDRISAYLDDALETEETLVDEAEVGTESNVKVAVALEKICNR